MTFTEPFFLLVFLPLALLAFHLSGRRGRDAALGVMVVASVLFFLPWGPAHVGVLLGSVIVNFAVGAALLDIPANQIGRRRGLLAAGLLFNLALLVNFKYRSMSGLHSPQDGVAVLAWFLPIGLSFYTFHQAAFLADAFAGERGVTSWLGRRGTPERVAWPRRFVRYAAFVTFFPQLVIGPITWMREFAPQTGRSDFGRIRTINLALGMALIAIGLFKKLVIADGLAPGADAVFRAASLGQELDPFAAWCGVGLYYLQLYFDFSGYSDMALGLGRLFGIRYPVNFDSPLRAAGIIDWYRRWHMTLTRVISRFLFTPLSLLGARFAARRRHVVGLSKVLGLWIPLLINFEVIGLWHGAMWTIVVFGLVHGLWYVVETEIRSSRAWKAWRRRVPDWRRWIYGHLILLALMPLTFALFRSDSLETFRRLALDLLSLDRSGLVPEAVVPAVKLAVLATLIVYLLPNSVEFLGRWRPAIPTFLNPSNTPPPFRRLRWRPDAVGAVFVVATLVIALWFVTRQSPFLYQGF